MILVKKQFDVITHHLTVLQGSPGGKQPRPADVIGVCVDGRGVLVRVVRVHERVVPLLKKDKPFQYFQMKIVLECTSCWLYVLKRVRLGTQIKVLYQRNTVNLN